jgi:hypothetical protein
VTGGSGGKVADDTLTADDVLESSLGRVPDAHKLEEPQWERPTRVPCRAKASVSADKIDAPGASSRATVSFAWTEMPARSRHERLCFPLRDPPIP